MTYYVAEQRVTKSTADSYLVRSTDGMDWARIFIQGGTAEPGRNWGYISVVSSFGNFGHCFSHIGTQAIEGFLLGVGFDYLMGKFFGLESRIFDADKTLKWLREGILERRRDERMKKERARDLWDMVQDADDNGYQTCEAFTHYLAERDSYFWEEFSNGGTQDSPNPQCVGFWQDIWPHFTAQLRAQLKQPEAA